MKKYNTKKIKNIISAIFLVSLLFWLYYIDWNNIFNKSNSGAFLGVLTAIMIIFSLQMKTKSNNGQG